MIKRLGSVLLAVFMLAMACAPAGAALKAGTAKRDITPELGCVLGGYYGAGRATGVHDPLHARILVLDDGERKVVMVSMDLIMINGFMSTEIKEQITKRYGIPPERVTISATHTHTGPEGYYEEFGKYPREYIPEMKMKIENEVLLGVGSALNSMQRAQAGVLMEVMPGYNHSRHISTGPLDSNIFILLVKDMDGKPIGGLFNLASHPVIVPFQDLLISADWPGVFAAEMEKKVDGTFMFLQGPAGDITPAGTHGENGWEKIQDYGERVAQEVIKRFDRIETTTDFKVDGRMETMILPVRTMKEALVYRKKMSELEKTVNDAGYGDAERKKRIGWIREKAGLDSFLVPLMKSMKRVKKGRTRTWMQVLRLGDGVMIAFPGEAIGEIGLRLRDEFKPHPVGVLNCTNDHLAYITTQRYYDEGGFESGMGMVYPESTEKMIQAAEEMTKALIKN